MAGPALFLAKARPEDIAWGNSFINFDHYRWFGAPNYVVMKLWRQNYAPNLIAISGKSEPLNAVATKSKDGKTLYFKAVNPDDKSVLVELTVKEGFTISKASMQLVAPNSLNARNVLPRPDAVHTAPSRVTQNGQKIIFTLPCWSTGVLTIEKH